MSDPTQSQALLLFGLLARHGECLQAELMPAIVAKDREALKTAKLIQVEKVGRSFYLKLDDAGWAWTSAHLAAELPPPQRTLSDLLQRLGEHLANSGETLADFIGSKPTRAPPISLPSSGPKRKAGTPKTKSANTKTAKTKTAKTKIVKTATKPRKTAAPRAKAPTPAALRKRIEAAYLVITGNRKNESVRLSQLRAALTDLDRVTVDSGLARILQGDKKASLMRHDDPRQLDQADRDAAFSLAGDPFHVLWIAS